MMQEWARVHVFVARFEHEDGDGVSQALVSSSRLALPRGVKSF